MKRGRDDEGGSAAALSPDSSRPLNRHRSSSSSSSSSDDSGAEQVARLPAWRVEALNELDQSDAELNPDDEPPPVDLAALKASEFVSSHTRTSRTLKYEVLSQSYRLHQLPLGEPLSPLQSAKVRVQDSCIDLQYVNTSTSLHVAL